MPESHCRYRQIQLVRTTPDDLRAWADDLLGCPGVCVAELGSRPGELRVMYDLLEVRLEDLEKLMAASGARLSSAFYQGRLREAVYRVEREEQRILRAKLKLALDAGPQPEPAAADTNQCISFEWRMTERDHLLVASSA